MHTNFPAPATQGPSRGEPATAGNEVASIARRRSSEPGSKASPPRSPKCADKSRSTPPASIRPGRSDPGTPWRTSFKSVPAGQVHRQTYSDPSKLIEFVYDSFARRSTCAAIMWRAQTGSRLLQFGACNVWQARQALHPCKPAFVRSYAGLLKQLGFLTSIRPRSTAALRPAASASQGYSVAVEIRGPGCGGIRVWRDIYSARLRGRENGPIRPWS